MKLTELKKNMNAIVLDINAANSLYERLLEIGFTIGTNIKFLYDFNSTFAYQIKNTLVALRKEDAEKIIVAAKGDI